ncbi:hypothetical protein EDC94DRAFT_617002 [Helicostylum pulchrum]|nr:hypothetical protein EDC94DRAFT_617002 [Helicostylum pulchrum]
MRIASFLILSTSIAFVKAIIPTPRYNGGCVAVSQRLYCYGGTSNLLPTSDHYVFDLSTDFPIDGSIEAWNKVVTGDFETEPNSLFSIVPLTDKYLIHGGLGYGSSTNFLKNTTTLYNALDGTWRTINSTNQTSMTPSREETSTLDSSNRIWTWGGISDNRTSVNITSPKYHDEFQVLDLNNMAWSFPDSTKTSYPRARIAHTATLGRSGQSIFYIGGLEVNDSGMLSSVSMGQIHEYHIANNTWTTHQSPSNSTIPSPRRLHTATQIPDVDLILVYGGSATDASKTVADYSYLLNTTSFQWTAVNILNTGAGPRFGHSAVLYKNSLFIVFGADSFGSLRNDFFVIDIINWQWVTGFRTDGVYPTTSIESSNSASSSSSSSTITNDNQNDQTSSANTNNQAPVTFNYVKTAYLIIGVMIIFTFL